MNTQLSDLMHRDVQDLTPDLDALTQAARRRGLSIRRRRQALSTLGAVAAVAVIAVGSTQLRGSADSSRPAATAPTTPAPTTQASGTTRLSGEATAAGLRDLLGEVVQGRATSFAGQDSTVSYDSYGELRWFPADGSGFSDVGLNVQPGFESRIYHCQAWQVACTVTRSGGAKLMTFEEVTEVAGGKGIRVTADLLRADGVRVVASATNGAELPANKWHITRARPAFTAQELALVVGQSWWGPRLPAELQREGAALPGYTDLDSDRGDWLDGSPTAKPTP
jgi:hypothetical protein